MDTTQINHSHSTSFTAEARLYQGQIYAAESRKYGVVSPLGCFWFPAALSCLLQPEVGDIVLFSQSGQQGYILAVLERKKSEKSIINLPNHTQIHAEHGVQINAGPLFSLKTKQMVVQAEQSLIQSQQLNLTGEKISSSWNTTQSKTQHQKQQIGQLTQLISQRSTHITQHDELRANSQRLIIAQQWRVRAKSADIKAQQYVAVDAEKIHLG